MTTRASTAHRTTPTGREEVAAAVLEAATDLFAERGPAATSIRDIAARSKVNHGLVFRHFGTKEQLVGSVLDYLGNSLKALLQSGASADVVDRALDRHMRVLARSLLDGYPAGQLQKQFPNVADVIEEVRPRHETESSARLAVANALALQFGWRLFAPMLRTATGLDMTDDELRRAVVAEVAWIIEPH